MNIEEHFQNFVISDSQDQNQQGNQQGYDLLYRPGSINMYEESKNEDYQQQQQHLVPEILTIKQKIETQEVARQHQKYNKKVEKTEKYEVVRYEVTLLIQIIRNEDKINFLEQNRIFDIFEKLIYQIDKFKVFSLQKSNIKFDPSKQNPYQVQFLVDFVTKIGTLPFQQNPRPVNYQEIGPEDDPKKIRYIVDYFLTMNPQYARYPQDFEDLALLGEGCFGKVKLVKYLRDNNIYALKIMKLKPTAIQAIKTMNQFAKQPQDKNNIVREIMFLLRMKLIFQLQHPNIIKLEKYWLQEQTSEFFILLQYFGGTKYEANSIFDFFHPKQHGQKPQHFDLGQENCKEVVAQIFYQCLKSIQFIHEKGIVHRDIKDDNFLIKRMCGVSYQNYKVPFIFQVALCDFGMSGFIDRVQSLVSYDNNDFRDRQNIMKFPAACDIYSLGVLLERLILLYNIKLKNYTSLNQITQEFKELMKFEYQLAARMKCQIDQRPKTIADLMKTQEYIQWLNSIPQYIPIYFNPDQ